MKRNILILIVIIVCAYNAVAETSTGTLFIPNNPVVNLGNIVISNGRGELLETSSGLKLFAGDRLETDTEEVMMIIPSSTLLFRIQPYSVVNFDSIDLGGQDFVVVATFESGNVTIENYQREELLQLLVDVQTPSNVERPDDRFDTTADANKIYVQVININANIQAPNFDMNSGVFITKNDVDIVDFIYSIQENSGINEQFASILHYPEDEQPLLISHTLSMFAYFYDFENTIHIAGNYNLQLQKGKFDTTLQIPIFYNRDNKLYNPYGANDMLFGSRVWEDEYSDVLITDRLTLSTQYILTSLLEKIKHISYGKKLDDIYFSYGEQEIIHNPKSTLFAYRYHTIKSTPNNFNQDMRFQLNFTNFGNTFLWRTFQPAEYTDIIINKLDIIYNRFWFRPILPMYPLEIGITGAVDLTLNKYSASDKDIRLVENSDADNRLIFVAMDISGPIINRAQYSLELLTEAGILLPFNSNGAVLASPFSNFGVKVGILNSIVLPNDRYTFDIESNVYYSRGFFRPHFAPSGYEYLWKPIYNRLVSYLSNNTEDAIFQANILTPELVFTLQSETLHISVGAFYPIGIATDAELTDLAQNPSAFIEIDTVLNILPAFMDSSLTLYYALPNLNFSEWDYAKILDHIGAPSSVIKADINFLIIKKIGFEIGAFNTPTYADTDLNYNGDTGLPDLLFLPYASVYLKF